MVGTVRESAREPVVLKKVYLEPDDPRMLIGKFHIHLYGNGKGRVEHRHDGEKLFFVVEKILGGKLVDNFCYTGPMNTAYR